MLRSVVRDGTHRGIVEENGGIEPPGGESAPGLSVTALCASCAASPYMPCGIAPGIPATGTSRFLRAAAYDRRGGSNMNPGRARPSQTAFRWRKGDEKSHLAVRRPIKASRPVIDREGVC